MLKEFREFAIRGNVVDMAVGLIIGAAFGTIVTSLVNDVVMPPIGLVLGGVDFANIFVVLKVCPVVTSLIRSANELPETFTLAAIVSPGEILSPAFTGAAGYSSYHA